MSMWNNAQVGLAQQKKGSTLTNVEKHQARVNNPVPDNIGCQYASEVGTVFFNYALDYLVLAYFYMTPFLSYLVLIFYFSFAPTIGKRWLNYRINIKEDLRFDF